MGKLFQQKKNRELKKLFLRSKRIEKFGVKCIKSNELIKKATLHLNNTRSAKYGYSPEQIEEQALNLLEDCIKAQQKIKAFLTETEYSK